MIEPDFFLKTRLIFVLKVSEEDFGLISQCGFNPEQISILWQFVTNKKHFVQNILDQISLVEYRFRELEWRLEARVASRSLLNQSVPLITLKFHLDSEAVNENKTPLAAIESSDKKTDTSQQIDSLHSRKKQVLFQTDPTNLLYIINTLEKALQEARTYRVRNVVKNL